MITLQPMHMRRRDDVMVLELYILSNNVIEARGVRDVVEDEFINNAAITVTLKDHGGRDVGGFTWPLILQPISGEDGLYRGVLEHDVALASDGYYIGHAEIDAGPGRVRTFRLKVSALWSE